MVTFESIPALRPRGGHSGLEKRRDESFFFFFSEKPLGTDSHRTISNRSSEYWLLTGHKKCFVLLCLIGEQNLLSYFCEFVHDGYRLDHGLFGSCTKEKWTKSGNFQFDINCPFQNTVYPKPKGAFPKTQARAYNRYSRLHRSRLRKY